MGQQTFRDESNRKHQPHSKHYVEDQFGNGNSTRNWKEAEDAQNPNKFSKDNKEEDQESEGELMKKDSLNRSDESDSKNY